ncbi:hypothetical protein CAV_1022 [Campylobacter avium LMG 24591]|uniref:SH3 domain-containing protein n=1 Tax=Campylobacter avium LMG 24591 TaxID=522484 RepID=A0A222MY67_9BACT|nr:hypothetical protein [Campylobacter avium]ASQ30678.1 hypothetical protein CAV_1022 [Campylobacter avium LMG 24591]OYD79774.1 hypothetical protein CAV8706_1025 [Campylobacter avium]
MRILLAVFLLGLSFLNAEIKLNETEIQIYKNISQSEEKEVNIEGTVNNIRGLSSLALRVLDYKKDYYVGEVFPITIYAKTDESSEFGFRVDLDKNNDLAFLNKDVKWEKVQGEYKASLWFEAKSTNAKLNNITISLTRNKVPFQDTTLNIENIRFKRVNADKNYANLVASELKVKKFRTNRFDDKNLVMIVELSAKNANLNNFNIANDTTLVKQRIDNVNGDFNSSSAFYSAIFAPSKNELSFSYFNTQSNKLEEINLAVELSSNETVNTQSDLNPTVNAMDFYKQLALWIIAAVCAFVYIFKRSYVFLAIALIVFILSFFVVSSSYKATIKANTSAKLLPTENSTYFYTSSQEEEVDVLTSRQNYKKVLFKNGKIGWVDEKDLQKN